MQSTQKYMADPEAPAKNYQVMEVSGAVSRIESKLDKLIDNQVTPADMDLLRRSFEDKLTNQRKEIDLIYSPFANNVKWFLRVLVVAVLAAAGDLVANLVLIYGKK